ncbi:hypothetical protein [Nocardia farcinica]|uniref:hypothetical protein n=1 Tax=Nocardia farcinica TaxID=37329 RepID=UPI0024558B7D|nr:hypothetical protein [Nocardia farcinica]
MIETEIPGERVLELYPNSGDIDPITNRIDSVQRALMTDRSSASRYGVAVDVLADGTLESVRIDESVTLAPSWAH